MALKVIKRYRVQDLEPGMVLGRTLLNEKGQVIMDQGKVILQEGTVISRELIDRLRNWNICVVDVQFLLPPPIQGQAAEKTERPVSVTALAADMLQRMSGPTVLSALLDRLTHGLGLLYPGDHVFISLLDGAPQRWWVIAAAGSFKLPDVALEQKFRGLDYLSGQTVMIGELSAHKAPPVLARADMLSMCGVPIIAGDTTVGCIELFSQRPDAFSEQDVKAIYLCASKAAVAIRNARIFDELRQTAEERDLLYEIMGFVSASMPPVQLLSKVADSLANYLSAHAVATEVMMRNFTRTDMESLKDIFVERWPPVVTNGETETNGRLLERQRAFTVNFSGGKSIYVLPLFSRDLLQGINVLLWEYDRKIDFHRHMEDMIRIVSDQTALGLERHHLYTGVEKIGLTDELTGLSNRRMFNYLIEREINRSRRYRRPLSLVMIDIDHFKKINDTWGHPVGDLVLRQLGGLMRENFRRLDVPVRYGGEEFAVILPETTLEEAIHFAERFRVTVEKAAFINGRERIPVTISLGVATVGNSPVAEELDADALLQMADKALYQAKQSGRNRIAAGRNQ
jgi:diguanylate cyclase (GGDEF)-like protein